MSIDRVLPRRLEIVIFLPFRVESIIDDTVTILLTETVLPIRVEA